MSITKFQQLKRGFTNTNIRELFLFAIYFGFFLIIVVTAMVFKNFELLFKISPLLILCIINIIFQVIVYNLKLGRTRQLIKRIRYGLNMFFLFSFLAALVDILIFQITEGEKFVLALFQLGASIEIICIMPIFLIRILMENEEDLGILKSLKLLSLWEKVTNIKKVDNMIAIPILYCIFIAICGIPIILPNCESYIPGVIIILTIIITIYIAFEPKQTKVIKANFINLDINKILENPIYIENMILTNNFRIIEIDISDLYPKLSKTKGFYIRNLKYVSNKNLKINKKTDKFYLAVAIGKSDTIQFDLRIAYKERKGSKTLCKKVNFYIDFKKCENEYIPGKIKICTIQDKHYKEKKFKDRERAAKITLDPYAAVLNGYQYNGDLQSDTFFTKPLYDSRKWLCHNGRLGSGKTTLDIIQVSSSGFNPVVISPWEENYTHDVLALIFKRLKMSSHKMFFFMPKVWIFYFLILTTSFPIINILVPKITDGYFEESIAPFFKGIESLANAPDLLIFCIYLFCIYLVDAIILYLVYTMLVPSLILFKKDYTKHYQEFFLNEIDKMLSLSKSVLIIEDIDRLNSEDQIKIFSILSVINKNCIKTKRYIGILSYDEEKMKKDKNYINFMVK